MKDFTKALYVLNKELIISTPITRDCFEGTSVLPKPFFDYIDFLESFREEVASCEGKAKENGFSDLVAMLPSSYKVVKL